MLYAKNTVISASSQDENVKYRGREYKNFKMYKPNDIHSILIDRNCKRSVI